MGTYAQWQRGAAKGKVRKFTWVCGAERVLVDEVAGFIIEMLDNPAVNELVAYYNADAPTFSESDLWVTAAAHPGRENARRLLVVRSANKLKVTDNLTWLVQHGRDLPWLYMLFISDDERLEYVNSYAGEEEHAQQLAYHLAALRDSAQGQLVVCSTPNAKDLVTWVQGQLQVSDDLAAHLLARCGGDLAAVRDTCTKTRALAEDTPLTKQLLDSLTTLEPATDFADALIMGQRRTALYAAMDVEDFGLVIGLLDARLDMLGALRKAISSGMTPAEMHAKLKIPQQVIVKFRQHASAYSDVVITRRRAVLTAADSSWRRGAPEGIAEFLVALW